MSYRYLLDIALILLSTKCLSLLTRRFNLPQVVGALLAGLILGPAMFNILNETEFISQMAELGVIVLMFTAGLESNIDELKESGKASLIIASLGVIIPLFGGFAVAEMFKNEEIVNVSSTVQSIFIGIVLTATSVSITVETLKELGKLSTRSGNAILGAAIIDDILGILALTVITSISDPQVSLKTVILKVIGFFIFALISGLIIAVLFDKWTHKYNVDKRRFVIFAFVICLLMSFSAEEFFGVADITGAFIAGLILSKNNERDYIKNRFETVSYMLLSPMFFASIGICITLPKMDLRILSLTLLLTIVAIFTKIIGCGVGAKICRYTNKESVQIGIGMISRGEVALIVASKGMALGLMSDYFVGPIIIMVLITTIITPVFLKMVFKNGKVDNYIEPTIK
ncbi:cation:proton antiporter [Clostridium butyricum]|uniref:Transporter, monovalent cation:proton antiporter-2 (CPA2) family n=1 Tax=Clostridium butyricum E4 str. BoNT E BL5262 TaxID=632245 RepID=C4IJ50_CLOBU|nr:cation:proton antiporter [Clostridium butyricum]EDT74862.1 Na(+)/H(+) antiporter [Clostridium butyricum 5521]EEP53655.1 transporter, monovalent cation:proton antiporter-2 (CPA2) family [Clostridium butyricum E4 str. BoNT E BL5262]NFL33468.1 cation:proton antiporter [Clostridium butyricum]NFS17101.1 cation:proton antiporter [Clostridium butyricum]